MTCRRGRRQISIEAETGPQHPRPAQIPMCACENTRPEHHASVKVTPMPTGATTQFPARPVSVQRWFGASCWLGLGLGKGLGRGQLQGLGAPGPRPALGRRQCLRHAPLRGTISQARGGCPILFTPADAQRQHPLFYHALPQSTHICSHLVQ